MEANKELTAVEVCRKHAHELSDGRYHLTQTAALRAMEEYANQWKLKYDELKAENEKLKSDLETAYFSYKQVASER